VDLFKPVEVFFRRKLQQLRKELDTFIADWTAMERIARLVMKLGIIGLLSLHGPIAKCCFRGLLH